MTEEQQRIFARNVVHILTDRSEDLVADGFDPTDRISEGETLNDLAELQETKQHNAATVKSMLVSVARRAVRDAYKAASNVVKTMTGYLGREHPRVHELRLLRDGSMNEDKRREFALQIIEFLGLHTQFLSDAGFDPADTITALTGLSDVADTKVAQRELAKADARGATLVSVAATEDAYKTASLTVEIAAGILGEDHQVVIQLRSLRHPDSGTAPEGDTEETGEA